MKGPIVKTLRDLVAVALLVTCVSQGGRAQSVQGTVVDSVSGAPVGVGFVVLLDRTGKEVSRALTSETGAFEIRAPEPGSYRLRSERIGYRPWESTPLELSAGHVVAFVARVTVLPVRLSAIEVTRETSCRLGPEESQATAILWEEARKALAAAAWNAQQRIYRQTLMSYERDVDRRRQRIQHIDNQFKTGLYDVPYLSVDAGELADRGYIVTRDGDTWYHAPDANVLLDESFHVTHCFRAVRGGGRGGGTGQIGLAFEPTRERALPDVRGVLWIDEASAELRSLEYSYTRVPGGINDDRVGGTVEFLQMPSGAWIVFRWQIRIPMVEEDTRTPVPGGVGRPTIRGFRDVGGEVLVVTTLAGDSIYVAPQAYVVGTVVDSTSAVATGLSDAVVAVDGTGFSGVTDWQGRFRLAAPLEGTFPVTFSHPRLDSLGLPAPTHEVQLVRDSTSTVDLAIRPMQAVLRELCQGPDWRRGTRVVHGVVRDRFARPLAGVEVRATWQDIAVAVTEPAVSVGTERIVRRTGDDGRYALCGLPVGRTITILASREESDGQVMETMAQLVFDPTRFVVDIEGRDRPPGSHYAPDPLWKLDLTLHPDPPSSPR